ncbi:MAG: hypothetical protein CBD18_01265 [Opitutales bacterium TMED158]|nr:MAG: hypothetical protein CBD18_01265 [Opitutales bacterium TMED158]
MTIRELARLAGVSRTTVSRALNNAPDVSEATKKRIVDLSKKLGYQANPMVTTLMSDVRRRRIGSRKSVLAIVPPDFQKAKWGTGNIAHRLYRKGVEDRAQQLGFQVEDFMVADYGGSFKRLSQVLYQRGIQAVLVPSIDVKEHPPEYEYELDWERFSVSGIGFSVTNPKNLDRAVMSQFGSALKALERMVELGYRRIAFGSRAWVNERVQGRWLGAYLMFQAMEPRLESLPHFLFEFGEDEKDAFKRWFEANRPEAILGERYLYRLLLDCGLSIPDDVSFALLDLIPGQPDCVDLAGMNQRFESVGAATVDLIAERINRNERGLPEEPHVLKVGGQWIDGPSLPAL